MLKEWRAFLQGKFNCLKPSAIIYVKASPETAMTRLQQRKRGEEKNVEIEYIKRLHETHEAWLGSYEPGFASSKTKMVKVENQVPVLIMDAELPLIDMPVEYEMCLAQLNSLFGSPNILLGNAKLGPDIIRFKRQSDEARIPTRGSRGAAGMDLYSAESLVVPGNAHRLVKTDVQVQFPPGCYGRIAPRSGLALNYGLLIGAGVIDPDYTGSIAVLLFNHSENDFVGILLF